MHHRRTAELLSAAGVDLVLCETFLDTEEIGIAVEEVRALGVPVWACLTAGPLGDLSTPSEVGAAARRAASAGATRVVVNCVGAARIVPFVSAIRDCGVPIGARPNVGESSEALGELVDWREPRLDPVSLIERARRWAGLVLRLRGLGISALGGCCGTSPQHVEALRDLSHHDRRCDRPT